MGDDDEDEQRRMKKEEKKPLDVATSISAAQGPETTYPCCREGFRATSQAG